MPEAETSQFQPTHSNRPPVASSKKSSEQHEVHVFVVEDNEGRKDYPLVGEVYSIGRHPKSDICLGSLFVSRRHATLIRQQRDDGGYFYQIVDGDLHGQVSANGILVNGSKLPVRGVHNLKNEDEVVFGAGVSAKYYLHRRDEKRSGPLDDITLIDPGMVDYFNDQT